MRVETKHWYVFKVHSHVVSDWHVLHYDYVSKTL